MLGRLTMIALGVLMLAGVCSAVRAASWNGIEIAEFSGVTLDKPLQVGTLDYTLSVADNATIKLGSETYDIEWVQAFYVVSGEEGSTFTATEGEGNSWNWSSKISGGGQISGWSGQGNDRIDAGESRTFHFGSFAPGRKSITTAYHVSYRDGSRGVTGWWKDPVRELSSVPEPSAVASVMLLLVGFTGLWIRRSRSRGLSRIALDHN